MALKLYNTLSRSLEPFEPLEEGRARVYGCGPTIYDYAHVGNYRSFVVYDLLHRWLEWSGYEVRYVMNLTDVDDKTIDAAVAQGVTVEEYTGPFGETFLADCRTLGILDADVYPKATERVEDMVAFVEKLVEKEHAYVTDDGSVYFSIASFPDYGKLSRIDPENVRTGERVAGDRYEKEDARDFALWKAAKDQDEDGGAAWDSPWGRGRPGWHLECSVMSITELGPTLDLHLGGEDLVFPHHEDEIAQSEAVTGRPFVRHWLHVKHLLLNGMKMSKSLGNTATVRELLGAGHEPAAIRHQLLSAHYRSELNFTLDNLEASGNAVQRLLDFEARLEATPVADDGAPLGLTELAAGALEAFREAMDDDLNSANALAALFGLVTRTNAALDGVGGAVSRSERDAVVEALRSMDRVLALLEVAKAGRTVDADTEAWIESMIEERKEARSARDFARADAIRDELEEKGIVLEDSADGTRWKVVKRGG
jgi:cysteinyl-tRNA synthetase